MEHNNEYDRSWLKARDLQDNESFKVRRGKIGGYVDYLEDDQIEMVNNMINETLTPEFGYHSG